MISAEARWVGAALAKLPDEQLFPLLNVGSQDAAFREKRQPWIDARVFAPLRARGGKIVHLDLAPGEGVDITGDLLDPNVRAQLRGFRSVLCANVLEHVPDRERFAAALADVTAPGGYLIVTVPKRFPYHPDPIDTMFRPGIEELAKLFPAMEVIDAKVVRSTMLMFFVQRLLMIRSAPPSTTNPAMRREFVRWLPRSIAATAIVFRKGQASFGVRQR